MMKTRFLLASLAGLSLGLSSCGVGGTEENPSPIISIISPSDTLNLSDSIDVHIVYSDDSGLTFTEVTLGTETGGNTVYHFSQRGISGMNDELRFQALVPSTLNITGRNYILVKAGDEDGQESILEQSFVVQDPDTEKPQILDAQTNGVLSQNPSVLFEISYVLQDNKALDELKIRLIEWNGSLGSDIYSHSIDLAGQSNASSFHAIPGSSSYQAGTSFKVKLEVKDAAGNSSEWLLPDLYNVL
tara:strand:+ start:3142 stop:3873 length:732 start_codon:yes stop_codon:yes gene_type:complete